MGDKHGSEHNMRDESMGAIEYESRGDKFVATFGDTAGRWYSAARNTLGRVIIRGSDPIFDRPLAREVGELLLRFAKTGDIRPPDEPAKSKQPDEPAKTEPPALPPGWRRDGDGTAYRDDGTEVFLAAFNGKWSILLPAYKTVARPRYFDTEIEAIRRADEVHPAAKPKGVEHDPVAEANHHMPIGSRVWCKRDPNTGGECFGATVKGRFWRLGERVVANVVDGSGVTWIGYECEPWSGGAEPAAVPETDPVVDANRRMPVGSKVKAAFRACHTAFWEAQVGEPFRLLGKDLVATVRSDDGTFWIAYNCEPVENDR